MTTHTLTAEQVQKFIKAIGGTSDCPRGDTYTTQHLRGLAQHVWMGLRDVPKHTDDPLVNYAVDCVTGWPEKWPAYDESMYLAEIEAFRDHRVLHSHA